MKSFPVPAQTKNNFVGQRLLLVLRIFDSLGPTESVKLMEHYLGKKVTKNPLTIYHVLRTIKCVCVCVY